MRRAWYATWILVFSGPCLTAALIGFAVAAGERDWLILGVTACIGALVGWAVRRRLVPHVVSRRRAR
jgi:hypothetical protein